MELTLEQRMFNILRTLNVKETKGKYRNALYRLQNKGLATRKNNEWTLTTRGRIMSSVVH